MKMKLTTRGTELFKQVREELMAPISEKSGVLFACFPALGIGHFSIQLEEVHVPFLVVREWKPELERAYPAGIYDLNDVYITERRIALSAADHQAILAIKKRDLSVEKSAAIMLDGAEYVLVLDGKDIRWKLIDGISPELKNALNKLCDLAGINSHLRENF